MTLTMPRPADPIAQESGGLRAARSMPRAVIVLLQTAVFIVALLLWQLSVNLGWADPFFVSKPSDVLTFLVELFRSGTIWPHIWATAQAVVLGFSIGSVAGVLVGFLFSAVPILSEVFRPFLTALNAIPRVALAPLFILWFGIGLQSKILLAVSFVFFIVQMSTEAAVKNTDRELLTMARLMGSDKRQLYMKVVLPASVPPIFAALRLGLVYTLLAVVFGEMMGSQRGLGQLIAYYAGTFQPAGVFAVLIVLVCIALILNGVMSSIERRLMRWNDPGRVARRQRVA